jgi:hypothetical protein
MERARPPRPCCNLLDQLQGYYCTNARPTFIIRVSVTEDLTLYKGNQLSAGYGAKSFFPSHIFLPRLGPNLRDRNLTVRSPHHLANSSFLRFYGP